MSDEDFTTAGGAGKAAGSAPGKHRGPRFTWNPQYEATFFRSLCESVSLGLRDGSTFKPEAWERAMQALIEKHNAYANKSHLINKTDNARKKYRLWRGLREDPEFLYDPRTRTVSATDDAWARHLQKEPLARSLRARPFDHEQFYEILFPDVIGSGGAPKRLTKPRRKEPDSVNSAEEQEAPIMDLLTDQAYINPSQTHLPPPMPPPTAIPAPMPAPSPVQQQLPRAPPTSMLPPPPPPPQRAPVSSTAALTPPEETALQTRKRLQAPENNPSSGQADKRRRTGPQGYHDPTQQQHQHQHQQNHHHQQPPPHQYQPPVTAPSSSSPATTNGATAPQPLTNGGNTPSTASAGGGLSLQESIVLLAEALFQQQQQQRGKAYARPGGGPSSSSASSSWWWCWQEQAMDIFFRDFAAEDMDLQLKIAEKVLADENKAMVFCKMPDALRRHWVKRLREVHNRIA